MPVTIVEKIDLKMPDSLKAAIKEEAKRRGISTNELFIEASKAYAARLSL